MHKKPGPVAKAPAFFCNMIVALLSGILIAAVSPLSFANPTQDNALFTAFEGKSADARITVIVTLNDADAELRALHRSQNQGKSAKFAYMQQRRNIIAQRQQGLIKRLDAQNVSVYRSYSDLPFLALKVNRKGLEALLAEPGIFVSPQRRYRPSLDTSVPLILDQVGSYDPSVPNNRGAGWAVAVLDTGIESTHPLLGGRIISEACYSTDYGSGSLALCPGGATSSTAAGSGESCTVDPLCSHGTQMAGIVAGDGDGVTFDYDGVAPGADLISIQVFSFDKSFPPGELVSETTDVISGLQRVLQLQQDVNGPKIASVLLSFGAGLDLNNCDVSEAATKVAIDNLKQEGIATVVAAGNNAFADGLDAPACITSAVSVGASNDSDTKWVNSNEATALDLYAPGVDITSSTTGGGEATGTGTSYSAAHVAGAWAVLKQTVPTLSVADGLKTLQDTGVPVTGATPSGAKRIQLDKAVASIQTAIKLVVKVNGGPVSPDFVIHLTTSGLVDTTHQSGDLVEVNPDPEYYTISQDPLDDYTLTGIECIDDDTQTVKEFLPDPAPANSIQLADQQSVTCTLTNEYHSLTFPIKSRSGATIIIDL